MANRVADRRDDYKTKTPEGDDIIMMSTKEATLYLGIHRCTLTTLAKHKKIPAVKIGRGWRFMKHLLDRWIEDQSMLNYRGGDAYLAGLREKTRDMVKKKW
jgi:excisionase family DNA binding protein